MSSAKPSAFRETISLPWKPGQSAPGQGPRSDGADKKELEDSVALLKARLEKLEADAERKRKDKKTAKSLDAALANSLA